MSRYRNRSSSSNVSSTTKPGQIASEAYKVSPDDIIFEDEPSMDARSFQDHLIVLYGAVKIGKTTLFRYFPGVYLLPTEPGYKDFEIRKTPIPNWATFRKFVSWAETHPKRIKDVKIWCIDTATNLSKFCMQWVCGREGIAHPSDQEWGKGWEAFADEFTHWILRLAGLNKGIGFIAHATTTEVLSRRLKITKEVPDLPRTTYRIINNLADIILHMAYVAKGDKTEEFGVMRCLYTKPEETRDAGDRTGKLPDVIKFKDEKIAVKKILSYFDDSMDKRKKIRKKVRKKGGVERKR